MGPKRDVVGELAKAIRGQDMSSWSRMHHAENWWFFPHWRKEFDTSDPRYAGLYGEPHNQAMGRTTRPKREPAANLGDAWTAQRSLPATVAGQDAAR